MLPAAGGEAAMRRSVLAMLVLASLGRARAEEAPAAIGVATMLPDGTIVLELRATGAGGTVGHGRLTYPPQHPDHAMVLRHLGGLRPGETKPVPPWN